MIKCSLAVGLIVTVCISTNSLHAEGAIAFGQFGVGGWGSNQSQNYGTSSEAQAFAMSGCNARAPNCKIVGTFRDTCAALAIQNGNNGWAMSTHSNINAARQDALNRCVAMGLSCHIVSSSCDTIDEARIRAEQQESASRQRAAEYESFLGNWNTCFGNTGSRSDGDSNSIQECNLASSFGRLGAGDRAKTILQRDALISKQLQRQQQQDSMREREVAQQRATEQQDRDAQIQRESYLRQRAEQQAAEAERQRVEAEQGRADAERRAREAEQRSRQAEQVTNEKKQPDSGVGASIENMFGKPISIGGAMVIVFFSCWAAIKELVKAAVPPKYKWVAAGVMAAGEWTAYKMTGIKADDPEILHVLYFAIPAIGLVLVFGVVSKLKEIF